MLQSSHFYLEDYHPNSLAIIEYRKTAVAVYFDGFGEYHRAGIGHALKLATVYQNGGETEAAIKVLAHCLKLAEERLGIDAVLLITRRSQLEQLIWK